MFYFSVKLKIRSSVEFVFVGLVFMERLRKLEIENWEMSTLLLQILSGMALSIYHGPKDFAYILIESLQQ